MFTIDPNRLLEIQVAEFGESILIALADTEHMQDMDQELRMEFATRLGSMFSDLIDLLEEYGFARSPNDLLAFMEQKIETDKR